MGIAQLIRALTGGRQPAVQDVRDARLRDRAARSCARPRQMYRLVREQVLDLELAVRRQLPRGERQPHVAVLHVERIEVDDHDQQIGAVLGALAVAEQLGVVGGVEAQAAVALQRRMRAADRVDLRDQRRQAVAADRSRWS